MITKNKSDGWDVSCDEYSVGCEEIEADSFSEVVQKIKSLGWRAFKIGDDWNHACRACVKLFSEAKDRRKKGLRGAGRTTKR